MRMRAAGWAGTRSAAKVRLCACWGLHIRRGWGQRRGRAGSIVCWRLPGGSPNRLKRCVGLVSGNCSVLRPFDLLELELLLL